MLLKVARPYHGGWGLGTRLIYQSHMCSVSLNLCVWVQGMPLYSQQLVEHFGKFYNWCWPINWVMRVLNISD